MRSYSLLLGLTLGFGAIGCDKSSVEPAGGIAGECPVEVFMAESGPYSDGHTFWPTSIYLACPEKAPGDVSILLSGNGSLVDAIDKVNELLPNSTGVILHSDQLSREQEVQIANGLNTGFIFLDERYTCFARNTYEPCRIELLIDE